MERGGCVYVMTNKTKTTLYVGVTSDLVARVFEHKSHKYPRSFTARYNLENLIYYEILPTIEEAIAREKQIKAGSRKKKDLLIQSMNPQWLDLYDDVKQW